MCHDGYGVEEVILDAFIWSFVGSVVLSALAYFEKKRNDSRDRLLCRVGAFVISVCILLVCAMILIYAIAQFAGATALVLTIYAVISVALTLLWLSLAVQSFRLKVKK
jgi:succinate dehydrogenase hydrophobic anchor subunit